jgi:hypothetical protein
LTTLFDEEAQAETIVIGTAMGSLKRQRSPEDDTQANRHKLGMETEHDPLHATHDQAVVDELHSEEHDSNSGRNTLGLMSFKRDLFTDDKHKPLDEKVLKAFSAFRRLDEELDLPALLSKITAKDNRLQSLSSDEAEVLLTGNPSLRSLLQEGWKEDSFRKVRQLGMLLVLIYTLYLTKRYSEILWPEYRYPSSGQDLPSRVSAGQSESGPSAFVPVSLFTLRLILSYLVTMQSWSIDYVGSGSSCLYEYLTNIAMDEDKYARYTSIIQSSGMGKSRMIDELSKTHLVVPLNFRQDSKGNFLSKPNLFMM